MKRESKRLPVWLRFPLQGVNYFVFMVLVWYFSIAPSVSPLAADMAVATMAFSHAGELREPCRQLTPEELAELPPNMRMQTDCPRERSPVRVEALMDGQLLFKKAAEPPGLYKDGSADIFLSAAVPAGAHHFEVKINDNIRVDGFTHVQEQDVTLVPGQRLVIKYTTKDGFTFN